jgi:hypothetical protein
MILEGIVTSLSPLGEVNIAPMGPDVEEDMTHFVLRPFPTSQTCQNLLAHPEGVLHVTDDVLLLAQAAVGEVNPRPAMIAAEAIRGQILTSTCRYYEFRIISIDEAKPRLHMVAQVVASGRQRDFFGFNRAKHAVVEAAILATRVDLLAAEEIRTQMTRLQVLVEKTGGLQEHRAFTFLAQFIDQRMHA